MLSKEVSLSISCTVHFSKTARKALSKAESRKKKKKLKVLFHISSLNVFFVSDCCSFSRLLDFERSSRTFLTSGMCCGSLRKWIDWSFKWRFLFSRLWWIEARIIFSLILCLQTLLINQVKTPRKCRNYRRQMKVKEVKVLRLCRCLRNVRFVFKFDSSGN